MHVSKIPMPQAKLPLPKWEIERTNRYRAILDNLVVKCNEVALALHQEILDQAALRAAAGQAAPIEPAAAPQPPPAPRAPKPAPSAKPEAPSASTPRPAHTRPELILNSIVRTIHACVRLDAWLGDRLRRGHTTAEQAGLAHPCRQDILDYLHNAARLADPHGDRSELDQELETRVSEELALNPNRNPADIIGELCTLFELPFDDADFPNNWRCETFVPPEPESSELPQDDAEMIREYIRFEELEKRRRQRRLE